MRKISDTAYDRISTYSVRSKNKRYGFQVLDLAFKLCCKYFLVTPDEISSKSRKKPLTSYRQMIMKFMYEEIAYHYGISEQYVCDKYFCRNHTTLIHAMKVYKNFIDVGDSAGNDYIYMAKNIKGMLKEQGITIKNFKNGQS